MKLLDKEIRKNKFDYRQVKRGEKAFIYSQYCDVAGKIIAYEVFKLRVNKPFVIKNKRLGDSEAFPSNEAFGTWAWVYRSLEGATDKFNELEQAKPSKRGRPSKQKGGES